MFSSHVTNQKLVTQLKSLDLKDHVKLLLKSRFILHSSLLVSQL
ncbi:MAG: hypothetical protein Q8S84_05510 [bacterium]|nr:hypothetical protein [bacterium]MDP3380947.1 hypothetical protein [bacterium]